MAINRHLFQAAATIYQSFLESPLVKLPQDPSHAVTARELALELQQAAKGDPDVLMAAARILCGFHVNTQSAHCTRQELVSLAVMGAQHLVAAFNTPGLRSAGLPTAAPVPQNQVTSFMPVVNAAPAPIPEPPQMPTLPLSVPDFGDGQ